MIDYYLRSAIKEFHEMIPEAQDIFRLKWPQTKSG
jgi:hypothetical protein